MPPFLTARTHTTTRYKLRFSICEVEASSSSAQRRYVSRCRLQMSTTDDKGAQLRDTQGQLGPSLLSGGGEGGSDCPGGLRSLQEPGKDLPPHPRC